jgi:hypothetical protein
MSWEKDSVLFFFLLFSSKTKKDLVLFKEFFADQIKPIPPKTATQFVVVLQYVFKYLNLLKIDKNTPPLVPRTLPQYQPVQVALVPYQPAPAPVQALPAPVPVPAPKPKTPAPAPVLVLGALPLPPKDQQDMPKDETPAKLMKKKKDWSKKHFIIIHDDDSDDDVQTVPLKRKRAASNEKVEKPVKKNKPSKDDKKN